MRSPRILFLAALMVAASAFPTPAFGTGTPEEGNPRLAWLERFQESRQGPEQTETFSGTYTLGSNGSLDLTHIAGDIRVTVGRGNDVRIDAVKRVRHRDAAEAKRLLGALRVEVTQAGGRLEIRTVYPRVNRGFNGSVDYTISVPQNAAVSLKTVSGDVRARDIASATLTLGTVSGTVVASGLKVRTLDASSVSGDLQLSNLEVERLTAKTLSGEIAFEGSLVRGGRYEFNAHSGNVRLLLSANTPGFELDASTFNGSVRSDFPVTLRSTENTTERRGAASRAVRGTYGDASAILALRSFSGNVVITKR
jgi:DUF4097 and DUF4098 domain-containing protein YvlB